MRAVHGPRKFTRENYPAHKNGDKIVYEIQIVIVLKNYPQKKNTSV